MKILDKLSYILLVVGGLNWLLVGLMDQDLGMLLFGGMGSTISKLIYVLVGLAAIWSLFSLKRRPMM